MLRFYTPQENTTKSGAETVPMMSDKTFRAILGDDIRNALDGRFSGVEYDDAESSMTVKWCAAIVTGTEDYTDESVSALVKKLGDIGKPWNISVELEQKDARKAYVMLTAEISYDTFSKEIESASKVSADTSATASTVSAGIIETLAPGDVTEALSGILSKEGFLQEIEEPPVSEDRITDDIHPSIDEQSTEDEAQPETKR